MEGAAAMKKAVFFLTVMVGVQALLAGIVCPALEISLEELPEQRLLCCVIACFGFLITVLLALLGRYLELPELLQPNKSRRMLSVLFPCASGVLLAVMAFAVRDVEHVEIALFLFGVVLLIANLAILYLLRSIERQVEEERERALLQQQMVIQTESIHALEKSYRAQRQASHEFQNQLQTIHNLLTRNGTKEALSYVEQLQGMQTTRVLAVNTHHPVLDAVLNQKYQRAKEANIEMQFRVNDLSSLKLETNVLVVLFSNLLDNAIEGCRKPDQEPTIQCTILLSQSLYLSIRNTSPPVVIKGKEIPTTKEPKYEHGYGLTGVSRILNDLNAEFTFDYSNGWFTFVAEIPL